jgi:superfamily II DNA or RNA helicase
MQLRDYQERGRVSVYNAIRAGFLRIIFWLATGGGKTITFCSIVSDAVASGGNVVVCVRRRELIFQASANLRKFGIEHGIYMANHPQFRPACKVQICSIDTLDARSIYPHSDKQNTLVIIDESHDVSSKARKYKKFLEAYNGKPIIGFTATPFGDNSLWEKIECPIRPHELMEQGHLVPCRTWAPANIDTSGIKITGGDFNESELFEASSSKEIVGDFVRDWKKYSQGRPTVLFAVNIEHSKIICRAFNDAGIRAVHADGTTKSHKRKHIIEQFTNGEIQVLCNVNIFSTGLDIPSIGCIQLCRPTQSLIWYLQAVGRGLRPSPNTGKVDCLLIDNAGNYFRFGSPYRIREAELGKPERKNHEDEVSMAIKRCEECLAVYEVGVQECPECGHRNEKRERVIKQREGDLAEVQLSEEEKQALIKREFISQYHKLKWVADTKLKRENKEIWLWESMLKKFGLQTCKLYGYMVQLNY